MTSARGMNKIPFIVKSMIAPNIEFLFARKKETIRNAPSNTLKINTPDSW